jgi:hypothetical protein
MSSIDRALQFLALHTNAAGQARLRFVAYGERPSAEAIAALLSDQRVDGGFAPFWAPGASSIDATCYRMAQLEQAGAALNSDARIFDALRFLQSRQQRDGSLVEDAALADAAPPWCAPGDPGATLYLTANAGFWLACADGLVEPANAAGRYLHNQLQKGDALASFRQANWLAAGLWHALGWHKPFDYTCAYLLRTLPELDAGDLAWLGTALLVARAPADHALLVAARARLMQLQRPDGGWTSPDGPEHDAHVSIEAVRVLAEDGRRPTADGR